MPTSAGCSPTRRHRGSAMSRDLLDDPVVMAVHRRFALIVVLSYFVAPVTAGLVATRKLRGGLSAFLWGGALRVFFVHHATWSVNSVCHLWGKRPFDTRDESRNNPLVALVGLGEGNHHNHHAFPRSAKHGLQRWQFDPTWWLIWTMEKTGLAWDVQRVSSEEMELKRVAERAPGQARRSGGHRTQNACSSRMHGAAYHS